MSSAKRTPRYVERIQPPHIQIVGPSTEAREAQVIPIRRITPAYTPVFDQPPAPTRKRASRLPVALRPWRVLVIPATPGAATRTLSVARWQARAVIGTLLVMVLLSGLAIGALVTAIQSPDLFATSADAATLRDQLLDMEDSLSAAREDLAVSEGARDSIVAMLSAAPTAKPPVVPEKPFARLAARKHLPSTRTTPRVYPEDLIASAPPSLEGLPVIGRLASGFSRSRRHPILRIRRPHLGVDIAAPRGTRVSAPADGRVTYVGRRFGYGLVIEITHTSYVMTRYAHLKKTMVEEGEQVTRGKQIGTVGSSGLSTGPHLHYEVLVNGRQVDPLRFRLPQTGDASTPTSATPVTAAPATAAPQDAGPPAAEPVAGSHDTEPVTPPAASPR
ncbi:MAG TPA: M23 family metallopeptidase [Gemmatimonadaceae bacterium]